jgi:hypothetical protein
MGAGEIEAHFEIQALKARYFRSVDSKDWQGLRALFTWDATLFFPEAQAAPLPLEDSIDFIAGGIGEGVSIHHGHMPEIEILSSSHARGVWAMEDRIVWPADRPSHLGLRTLHGFGHYHEDYVRTDRRWLIRTLKVVRMHATAVPAGGEAPAWAR